MSPHATAARSVLLRPVPGWRRAWAWPAAAAAAAGMLALQWNAAQPLPAEPEIPRFSKLVLAPPAPDSAAMHVVKNGEKAKSTGRHDLRAATRVTAKSSSVLGMLRSGSGSGVFADTFGAGGLGTRGRGAVGALSGVGVGEASGIGDLSVSGGGGAAYAARPASAEPVAALRAGATDDNADFTELLRFQEKWRGRGFASAEFLDVRGRRHVRVVDAAGLPVPAARIQVSDAERDRSVWTATTYGDGRTPFYPRIARHPRPAPLNVEAWLGARRVRATWDGASDLVLELPGESTPAPRKLDVVFAIDTTGSMGDEIGRIKSTLRAVNTRLKGLGQDADLRYGAVLFRDRGDEYVTRALPFTRDIDEFSRALQAVEADGGGDTPESVNRALAEAVHARWRDGAARVVFLIGDAPPHTDYAQDTPYHVSLLSAVAEGVRVHAIAASGLDAFGTLVWRQVAQFTRGKFIFIEYGDELASADSHGVSGRFTSNNLDRIIFEQIRDELRAWGRPDEQGPVAHR